MKKIFFVAVAIFLFFVGGPAMAQAQDDSASPVAPSVPKDSWGVVLYGGGALGSGDTMGMDDPNDPAKFVDVTNGSTLGVAGCAEVGQDLDMWGLITGTNFGFCFDVSQIDGVIEEVDGNLGEEDKTFILYSGLAEMRTDQGAFNPFVVFGVGWAQLPVFGNPDALAVTVGGGVEYKVLSSKNFDLFFHAKAKASYMPFVEGDFFVSQLLGGFGIRWHRW